MLSVLRYLFHLQSLDCILSLSLQSEDGGGFFVRPQSPHFVSWFMWKLEWFSPMSCIGATHCCCCKHYFGFLIKVELLSCSHCCSCREGGVKMSCQSATVWPVTHLQSCGCRNLVLVYHVIENLGKAHMYYCYAHRYKFNIITVMFSSCFTLFGGCLQAFYFVHVKPSFVFGIFIVEHKKKTLSALRHTFHESYINDA